MTKNTLRPNEVLNFNDKLVSNDGRFVFIMQTDGNLVLYHPNGNSWGTGTEGTDAKYVIMQTDGNLVIYNENGQDRYGAGTEGNQGAYLVLENNGFVIIYSSVGQPLKHIGVYVKPKPMFNPINSGNILRPGDGLTINSQLRSNDGRFNFIMQSDGNLVLYHPNGDSWGTGTEGTDAKYPIMQGDGNLVLYDDMGEDRYGAGTEGNAGAYLILENNGTVIIYNSNGNILKTIGQGVPYKPTFISVNGGNRLNSGEGLNVNSQLSSNDGRFTFIMQSDGNLVLYHPNENSWGTGTEGTDAKYAIMQSDGNLVLYNEDGYDRYGAGTERNPNAYLVLQDDGIVVIYSSSGNKLKVIGNRVNPKPSFRTILSGDRLNANEGLAIGNSLMSPNGKYIFSIQHDGNLVIKSNQGSVLWKSDTGNKFAKCVIMQSDGNLVTYDDTAIPRWDSKTNGNSNAFFVLQNDGNGVVRTDEKILWASEPLKLPPPQISNFSPLTGKEGTILGINGSSFYRVIDIKFSGDWKGSNIKQFSDKYLEVTVPSATGNGPIKVICQNGIAQSSESFTRIIDPVQTYPNLVFGNMWKEPAWPEANESFVIYLSFFNNGNAESGNFEILGKVYGKFGNTYSDSITIDITNILASSGDTAYWSFPGGLPKGSYSAEFYLDPNNSVFEYKENDNATSISFIIGV